MFVVKKNTSIGDFGRHQASDRLQGDREHLVGAGLERLSSLLGAHRTETQMHRRFAWP